MSVEIEIALDDEFVAQVDALAQELRIPHTVVITLAVAEFAKLSKQQRMIAAINAAYANFPDEEEAATLRAMQLYQARLAADDPW